MCGMAAPLLSPGGCTVTAYCCDGSSDDMGTNVDHATVVKPPDMTVVHVVMDPSATTRVLVHIHVSGRSGMSTDATNGCPAGASCTVTGSIKPAAGTPGSPSAGGAATCTPKHCTASVLSASARSLSKKLSMLSTSSFSSVPPSYPLPATPPKPPTVPLSLLVSLLVSLPVSLPVSPPLEPLEPLPTPARPPAPSSAPAPAPAFARPRAPARVLDGA